MDELKFNVPIPPMEFRELSKTGNPKLDKELDRGNRSVKKDSQRKRESEPHRAIHFMWFHFLRLCLELEEMNYFFQKRGAKGKIIGKGKKVSVSKKIYKDWDLDGIMSLKFNDWYYTNNKKDIFNGKMNHIGRPQYNSLVKKYNVFVRYFNGADGNYDNELNLCEKIVLKLEKKRYDRVDRTTNKRKSDYRKLVWKEVKSCEDVILACCNGEFPKSV